MNQPVTLKNSFQNVINFYQQTRAFFELVKKQLGGTFRVPNRSGKDSHFIYDTTHVLARPETWLSSHFTIVLVPQTEENDRTPNNVLFFTIDSDINKSGAPFNIVGGVLNSTFLENYKKDGATPYWDYQKLFKECKSQGGELKHTGRGVATPVESTSIFSSKEDVVKFINLVSEGFGRQSITKQ